MRTLQRWVCTALILALILPTRWARADEEAPYRGSISAESAKFKRIDSFLKAYWEYSHKSDSGADPLSGLEGRSMSIDEAWDAMLQTAVDAQADKQLKVDRDLEALTQAIATSDRGDSFLRKAAKRLKSAVFDTSHATAETTYKDLVAHLLEIYYEHPEQRPGVTILLKGVSEIVREEALKSDPGPDPFYKGMIGGVMIAWTAVSLYEWRGGIKALGKGSWGLGKSLGKGVFGVGQRGFRELMLRLGRSTALVDAAKAAEANLNRVTLRTQAWEWAQGNVKAFGGWFQRGYETSRIAVKRFKGMTRLNLELREKLEVSWAEFFWEMAKPWGKRMGKGIAQSSVKKAKAMGKHFIELLLKGGAVGGAVGGLYGLNEDSVPVRVDPMEPLQILQVILADELDTRIRDLDERVSDALAKQGLSAETAKPFYKEASALAQELQYLQESAPFLMAQASWEETAAVLHANRDTSWYKKTLRTAREKRASVFFESAEKLRKIADDFDQRMEKAFEAVGDKGSLETGLARKMISLGGSLPRLQRVGVLLQAHLEPEEEAEAIDALLTAPTPMALP